MAGISLGIAAYFVGCFCGGHYVLRLLTGEDIRGRGSGSTGARNAGRVLGRRGFVVVFLVDLLKGTGVMAAAVAWDGQGWGVPLALVGVVAGHVYPVQLGFRGGRGAATTLGALLALNLHVALLGLLVAALAYPLFRLTVPSGLAGFTALPGIAAALGLPWAHVAAVAVVSVLVLWAHRSYWTGRIDPAPSRVPINE